MKYSYNDTLFNKKMEVLIVAITKDEPQGIMLSESSQAQKTSCYMIL